MLVYDKSYLAAIHSLIKDAKQVRIAVAFWGAGGESAFKHWHGESIRIICNLALGGTNPDVIFQLRSTPGAEIRQLDELHAKLILTDRAMLLGSANISANGLGLEARESAGFRELGVQISDAELLDQANAWFDSLWRKARVVENSDLERAREFWRRRRSTRPSARTNHQEPPSLLNQSPDVLKDREIYFAVFRKGLSQVAQERRKEENDKLAGRHHPEHEKLDLYEGWEADDLPKDPSAIVIPVYWGKRGKIKVCLPQRPVPELEDSYVEDGEDGAGSEVWRLDFTAIVKNLETLKLPFQFEAKDRNALIKPIGDWLTAIVDQFDDGGAICLPVYEFLRWRHIGGLS